MVESHRARMRRRAAIAAAAVAVGVLYFVMGRLCVSLAIPPGMATPIWIPAGVALAGVLRFGRGVWPGIWLGSATVNLPILIDPGDRDLWEVIVVTATIATASTIQFVLAGEMIRRLIPSPRLLDRVRDVLAFVAVIAGCCMIAATVAATAQVAGAGAPWRDYGWLWITWWVGDSVGALLITPLALMHGTAGVVRGGAARWIEVAVFTGLLLLMGWMMFSTIWPFTAEPSPGAFVMFPFALWAALRFRQRGVVLTSLLICGIATFGTLKGHGPFVGLNGNTALLVLQAFIATMMATSLVFAAALVERDHSAKALLGTEQQLRRLNQTLEQQVAERTAVADRRADLLQALASQLIDAEQGERKRVAQLLHDHFQQLLVAAKMRLTGSQDRIADPEVRQHVAKACELISDTIRETRSLVGELHPIVLHMDGLAAALVWLRERKFEKYGLRVDVSADPAADPNDEHVSVLLFQATRELLFNVAKHAGVDRASVRLDRDGPWVRITVEDGGRGFDAERSPSAPMSPGGFGLFTIRERLRAIGGQVVIESGVGRGTRVMLLAPAHIEPCDAAANTDGATGAASPR